MDTTTNTLAPPPPADAVALPRSTARPAGGGRSLHAPLVRVADVSRRWGKGEHAHLGVDGVDLALGEGELASIVGPSGSGKSTLGALIAGIDRPTSGSIVVDGTRIDQLAADRVAQWRGHTVGVVFQDFHLLPTLTAIENVELALSLSGRSVGRRERRERSRSALAAVGMADKARRLPSQLSGGEQQRVAIARATVKRPSLIVADEPTGSLDQASGHVVFDLLVGFARAGTTVVFITHDHDLARRADRQIGMLDGRVDTHTAGGVDVLLDVGSSGAASTDHAPGIGGA